MVSQKRSSRNVNLPPVSNDPVQITQDDVDFNTENVDNTEDDTAIEAIIKANPTAFRECVDEDYAKSVNNQHYLANPHLPNPNITKAEHVAKLNEVCKQEAATGDTAIEAIIKANPTTFREFIDEDYAKSVNNQHYLANPHLPNPNITKAEHVAKLKEVCKQEAATGTTTPAKVYS